MKRWGDGSVYTTRMGAEMNGRAREARPLRRNESYLAVFAVTVAMVVTPGPIFFLLLGRNVPEVAILVTMVFVRPLVVVADFIVVPDMVVAVIRIIDTIVVMFASDSQNRDRHRRSQKA